MSDTNAGLGMVPCKTGCRCDDCEITRLTERNAELADNAADLLAAKIRLEAECERLEKQGAEYYGAGCDALDKAIAHEQRADQLQAKLDAINCCLMAYEDGLGDEVVRDIHRIIKALNAPETA